LLFLSLSVLLGFSLEATTFLEFPPLDFLGGERFSTSESLVLSGLKIVFINFLFPELFVVDVTVSPGLLDFLEECFEMLEVWFELELDTGFFFDDITGTTTGDFDVIIETATGLLPTRFTGVVIAELDSDSNHQNTKPE